VVRQQVPQVLRLVGLAAKADRLPRQLSGGEQQRVSIARAFVNRPLILFADEPTGNLDHRTAEKVFTLLDELHRAHGLTSVYVTHNLSFASRCDRVLKLEGGTLAPCPLEDGKAYV
jgi:predicted ABC-type transport system involved in lysophospholipase L1 biosynthesis ATPase subunit